MIHTRDVITYIGGLAMQEFGSPVWRASTPDRQGELKPMFTRSNPAAVLSPTGKVTIVEANEPRIGWLDRDSDGVYDHPVLMLENVTNLLQRSQEFDNAYWTKKFGTITANATAAPDGTITADEFVEDTSTGEHVVYRQTLTATAGNTWCGSVYLKANTRTWARLRIDSAAASTEFFEVWVNLSTGALGTQQDGTGATIDQAYVEDAGNGWYRVTVSGTVGASRTDPRFLVYMTTGDAATSHVGDGSSSIYVWGAQFEDENYAYSHSYIPTTTAAVTITEDFSVPFNVGIEPLSTYLRFVERGSAFANVLGGEIFNVGGTSNERLFVTKQSGQSRYEAVFGYGASSTTVAIPAGPVYNTLVEIIVRLDGSFGLEVIQSLDGAAQTGAGPSGSPTGVAANWNSQLLTLGSDGLGSAYARGIGYAACIVARGSHDLADFRSLLPQ